MKKTTRQILFALLMVLVALAAIPQRSTYAGETVTVPIILYHNIRSDVSSNPHSHTHLLNITPQQFRLHMETLQNNGFNAISFGDFYAHVRHGASLPSNPIIITFDDGYESNYIYAFPILRELGMRATIFVITDRRGARAGQGAVTIPHFTWEQARTMQESGIIDIESHSHTHGNMAVMTTADLQRELRRSRFVLETELDRDAKVFSFPFGGNTTLTRRLATAAGYKMATIVGDVGANSATDELAALRRITVNGLLSGEELLKLIDVNLDK